MQPPKIAIAIHLFLYHSFPLSCAYNLAVSCKFILTIFQGLLGFFSTRTLRESLYSIGFLRDLLNFFFAWTSSDVTGYKMSTNIRVNPIKFSILEFFPLIFLNSVVTHALLWGMEYDCILQLFQNISTWH